jgi:hypothetical protein
MSKEGIQYLDFEPSEREWFFSVAGELSCFVCKEVFDDPVVVSCGHVFCHDCVKPKVEYIFLMGVM